MFHNSNLEESIEIWGENFSRSQHGLNEEQVKAFIGRLISEREVLLERNRQLKSLAQQAEKITLDADGASNEIIRKAQETAGSQSAFILERAREQANRLFEIKQEQAAREAESIIEKAREFAKKCVSEAEREASDRARAIIMNAMAEGNRIIENKRLEAETVAQKTMDAAKLNMLAETQKRLKAAEAEAEAFASSQAQAILSSKRENQD